MAPPSEARFRRALARLDPDAATEFFAALLAARGEEVSVADGVVRTAGPGHSREFIVVGSDGDAARGGRTVLVDTGGSRSSAAADSSSVGYLGPMSLYRMLLYAVDRSDAEHLAAAHLDLDFDAAEGTGLDRRLPTGARSVEPVTAGIVALLVLLATVAGGVSLVGDGGGRGAGPSADASGARDGVAPDAITDGSGGPTGAAMGIARDEAAPPGIDDGRIEDIRALAMAHRNATRGRSYSLLVTGQGYVTPIRHQPSLATFFGQPPPWYSLRQRLSVERPSVYRSRVTGIRADGPGQQESVVFDDYADGEAVYRRYGGPNQTPRFGRLQPVPGLVSNATASYIERYLATSNTTVTRDRATYRVVATGTPRYLDVPVEDYRAVARVSPAGFVYRLQVEYQVPETAASWPASSVGKVVTSIPERDRGTVTDPGDGETTASAAGTESGTDQTATYTFGFSYDRIGGTEATRPAWYERAREATTNTPHPAGIQPGSERSALVDALAESHGAVVRSNSYRWRVGHHHSLSGGLIEGRWTRSQQRVAVANPSRYSLFVQGSYRTASGTREDANVDVYADGEYRYRRRGASVSGGAIPPHTIYDRVPLPVEPIHPFARIAERYVRRYLAAETVTVTVRENASTPRYRVVATGTPTRLPGAANVTNYRAVAEVRASGLVESLSVEYLRTEPGAVTGVEFEFAYDEVGTTTVEPPSWYDEARRVLSAGDDGERDSDGGEDGNDATTVT